MYSFNDESWIWIFGIVGIFLLGLILVASARESKEWEQFKIAHSCKVVAKVSGDVFNTYGIDGKGNLTVGIGTTSDKTGWSCDDGITYYK